MAQYRITSKVTEKCNLEVNHTYKRFDEVMEFFRVFKIGIDLLSYSKDYIIKFNKDQSVTLGLSVADGRYFEFTVTKEK